MDTKQLICPAGHRDGYLYKVRKPFTKMGFVDTLKNVLWMCTECEEEVDLCTHCGRDTSFSAGNGLYVNRLPSDDGYMCVECQLIPCDRCEKPVLDYEILDGPTPELVCPDCKERRQ